MAARNGCLLWSLSVVLVCVSGGLAQLDLDLEMRDVDSNEITLLCRDSGTLTPLSDADFWVNNTNMTLPSLLENYTVPGDGRIAFTLTPDIEGLYYCGDISAGTSSESMDPEFALVGKSLIA